MVRFLDCDCNCALVSREEFVLHVDSESGTCVPLAWVCESEKHSQAASCCAYFLLQVGLGPLWFHPITAISGATADPITLCLGPRLSRYVATVE